MKIERERVFPRGGIIKSPPGGRLLFSNESKGLGTSGGGDSNKSMKIEIEVLQEGVLQEWGGFEDPPLKRRRFFSPSRESNLEIRQK